MYFPERVGMKALKRREEDQQECPGINKAQGKVSCAKKGPKVMGTNQGTHLLQVNLLTYISTSVCSSEVSKTKEPTSIDWEAWERI